MKGSRAILLLAGVALAALNISGSKAVAAAPASAGSPSTYDHIFVVVEENHGFTDVIPNPAAPNLNLLVQQYGLATNYYGVSHPSEPNYVALLGGSTFGVQDDNPYWMNTVRAPSLISQLDTSGVGWKAYLDGSPHPGYKGMCYPVKCNGSPDIDPLYVSKHNGIGNFTTSRSEKDWSRQVPIEQLSTDLASGNLPRFGYVIPSECRDMHGDPPYCLDSGNPFDPQDQKLVSIGDRTLGHLVSSITGASFWSKANNAVVILFDEGDDNAGCCRANPGGGRVATLVVTSHGPRHLQDGTAYNHYSLLLTLQRNFGLGCLANTCDTGAVRPMSPLLTVTGSSAEAFHGQPQRAWPTPTPTPVEPASYTTRTPSAGGWSVLPSPMLGTNDNSLGAVAASGPDDVWAVGNFIPDTAGSNQDATITLANHWNGKVWTAVPTPNAGPNFNTLFGVAASAGRAWAVGVRLDDNFNARALIQAWDGTKWTVVPSPQPGSQRDILFGASAVSPTDVWAVGEQQGADGKFETLAEHWNGTGWSVVPGPNPGSAGNSLYGVHAVSADDVWAVGQTLTWSGSDQPLVEHWNGKAWSASVAPSPAGFAAALYSVTGDGESLWAVGEADSLAGGSRPLVERFEEGGWQVVSLPVDAGSQFSALWSVAAGGHAVWAVGTAFDARSGNVHTLVLRGGEDQWSVVATPDPGSGDNVLGGVVATGDTWWSVGHYKDNGRKTLIERHQEG